MGRIPKRHGCSKEIPVYSACRKHGHVSDEGSDIASVNLAQAGPYVINLLKRWRDSIEAQKGSRGPCYLEMGAPDSRVSIPQNRAEFFSGAKRQSKCSSYSYFEPLSNLGCLTPIMGPDP
ncbi:hypothetical protein CRG98_004820 [Punica granatum]|uniref:Uncharacterized protein n=1 Tax=Punica granatum TaxID=22663 RepID=A0A2I0L265_PUNGR|nr:hypothetical protein CRG98_004820 [Punica granatum]